MLAGGGGGAGLVLVALAVAWWEFQRRRVNRVDDISEGLGIHIVGTVPEVQPAPRVWLPWRRVSRYRQNALTESVDRRARCCSARPN